MSNKRHFDFDPATGINEIFHYNEDGSFAIEAQQDVEPIAEASKRSFNAFSGAKDKWGDGQRVASIPLVILQDWMASGKIRDQAFIKRWLNDPDNAVFRTRPGRV